MKCARTFGFSGVCRFAGCEKRTGREGIFLREVCAAMTVCFHMFLCCSIIEPMGFLVLSCKPMHGPNMKSAGRQRQLKCAEPRVFVGMCHFVGRKDRGRKRICLPEASVAMLSCFGLFLFASTIEMLGFFSLGVRGPSTSKSSRSPTLSLARSETSFGYSCASVVCSFQQVLPAMPA